MAKTPGIRVAVVGLGFGADFLPIYLHHPGIEAVAICDQNEALMAKIGDKFGIEHRFTSLEDMLATDEYDAVHLLTPVALHANQVVAVLRSGKHCACAVPMATTLDDIKRIIVAQRESGKNYMMMETAVYMREFLYVKQLYDDGEMGPLTFLRGAHMQDLEGFPDYWKGYPPMLYVTHALSPLLALANTRVSKVHCFGSGRLRADLHGSYDNPFPLETALFSLDGTDLAAEVTMSFFQVARSYVEGFTVYGERKGFEWQQFEEEQPALFTLLPRESGRRGRQAIKKRVKIPDRADLLPPEIARFTKRTLYDESDPQRAFPVGDGHGGSHPHLVHEFVQSILEARTPAVNAITAANWTAPGICAHESALHDGNLVMVPDFTKE